MGQFALEAHSESPKKSWLGTKRELEANSSVYWEHVDYQEY